MPKTDPRSAVVYLRNLLCALKSYTKQDYSTLMSYTQASSTLMSYTQASSTLRAYTQASSTLRAYTQA
ncbi:unnamed protein product [Gadus morhua 'NCC']